MNNFATVEHEVGLTVVPYQVGKIGLELSMAGFCLLLGVLLVAVMGIVVVGIVFKEVIRPKQVVAPADGVAVGSLRSAFGWLVTVSCGLGVLLTTAGVLVESARTMNGAPSGLVSIDRDGWIGVARTWLTDSGSAGSTSGETVIQEAVDSEMIPISKTSIASQDERLESVEDPSAKPDWIETPPIEGQDRTLLVVSSDPRLEREAALSEAWMLVRARVQRDFAEFDDRARDWSIPLDTLKKAQLVRQRHDEQYQTDLGSVGQAEMHIMHLQFELSPRGRDELNAAWQQELVRRRVAGMGIIAAFLTVCFGSAAVGLRSNTPASGGTENRVKLACSGVVGLAGAMAVCGLNLV